MARKLLIMMALISLVFMVQASASLATTYELGQQGDDGTWTWKQGYSGGQPWDQGTEFIAGGPSYADSAATALWKLGFYDGVTFQPYKNLQAGSHTDTTFTVVFDSTAATPNFSINIPGVPNIISNNTIFTYNATYANQGPGLYTITSGVLTGNGTHYDGIDFQFTIVLQDILGDHKNTGYIKSFTLEYPSNGAAQTPIPGAVWLLGTGLLGLACVGRRRRRS
jgi:hypothetical protein